MDERGARITISRRDPKDVRDRQIVVSLDGEPFATLLFGNEASRDVAPGNTGCARTIRSSGRRSRSRWQPGEHAHFTVVNRAGMGTFSLLGLLGVGPLYLTFERQPPPSATGEGEKG